MGGRHDRKSQFKILHTGKKRKLNMNTVTETTEILYSLQEPGQTQSN